MRLQQFLAFFFIFGFPSLFFLLVFLVTVAVPKRPPRRGFFFAFRLVGVLALALVSRVPREHNHDQDYHKDSQKEQIEPETHFFGGTKKDASTNARCKRPTTHLLDRGGVGCCSHFVVCSGGHLDHSTLSTESRTRQRHVGLDSGPASCPRGSVYRRRRLTGRLCQPT